MRDDVNKLLTGLAASEPDRSLVGFETAVLRDIAVRREAIRISRMTSAYRAATVSVALAIGVTAGGFAAATTAAQPRQVNPFSASTHLAPSNLLEGGQ